MDELLHVRSYLNEGGKVLYTGQAAGHQYTTLHGAQFYDPTEANERCTTPPAPTLGRCLILYGSPSSDLQNDVIEYWFGAFLTNHFAGFDDDGNNLDVIGTDTPLTGSTMTFNGGDSADNQFFDDASFITTSGILDPRDLSAVRELGGGQVRPPGWALRPAQRDEVRLLADRRPDVQALDPHGERPCRRSEHVVLDLLQHGVRLGSRCSSRLTPWARTTGRPSKT